MKNHEPSGNYNKKQKNYLETKLSRAASVIMSANRFKEDPKKLAEFIENNITYFPNIDDEFLHNLRISDKIVSNYNINVPTFSELDSENKTRS
jgi:hypothetical protein